MANVGRRTSVTERLSQPRDAGASIAASDSTSPVPTRTGLLTGQLSERFADTSTSAVLSKLIKQPSARRWERDSDIERLHHGEKGSKDWWRMTLILSYGTLGVVYGDIGTSPLYVMSSVFDGPPSEADVVGVVSLIIWSIGALLGIKYAAIVLCADDNGQGGAFALFSILKRQGAKLLDKTGAPNLDAKVSQFSVGPKKSQLSNKGSSMHSVRSGPSGPPVSMVSNKSGHTAPPVAPAQPADWRQRLISNTHTQRILRVAVVFGVGAILSDGILTPSISVVSAFEGLQVRWPSVSRGAIDGAAIAVLVALFLGQRFGTAKVGFIFSPVITIWLLANAIIGIYNIARYDPGIFRAIGPNYWFGFFLRNHKAGWQMLGGVLLCFTGVEALFADLGHFSRPAIQLSTYALLIPSLFLTYLGQGAYLIHAPQDVATTFWSALPNGTFYPMFIVATLAAIIASQALISAVFQIAAQAIKQGYLPRFAIHHTSRKHAGQLYIPVMNYLLMTLCIIVVATFRTSARLGRAYGLAVICDMLLTTHFLTLVMITVWRLNLLFVAAFYIVFATVEATYLSSTAEKVPTGGWFTLMLACIWGFSMLLYNWGVSKKALFYRKDGEQPLSSLLMVKGSDPQDPAVPQFMLRESGQQLAQVPGAGLYYADKIYGVPPVLRAHVAAFPVLHSVNFFVNCRMLPVPIVEPHERFLLRHLGLPCHYAVIARYGYMDTVQQGGDFPHRIKELVLGMLYNSLQGALDRNADVVSQLRLDYQPGYASEHSITITSVPSTIEEGKPAEVAISMPVPSTAQPFDGVEWAGQGHAVVSPFATSAGGAQPDGTFVHTHDPDTAAPLLSPKTRTVLEKVVRDLVAIPLGQSHVSVQQRSAFHLLWLMAAEIHAVASALDQHKAVYVLGIANPKPNPASSAFKRYLLELPFQVMVKNLTTDADASFQLPREQLLKLEIPYLL